MKANRTRSFSRFDKWQSSVTVIPNCRCFEKNSWWIWMYFNNTGKYEILGKLTVEPLIVMYWFIFSCNRSIKFGVWDDQNQLMIATVKSGHKFWRTAGRKYKKTRFSSVFITNNTKWKYRPSIYSKHLKWLAVLEILFTFFFLTEQVRIFNSK